MAKQVLSEEQQGEKLFKLRRSLYSLKDAAGTCSRVLSNTFSERGLRDMDTALCVFVDNKAVVLCYVDDFVLFANVEGAIDDS